MSTTAYVTLNEIVDYQTGYPFKSKEYAERGIRLLRGDNIAQGNLRWDGAKFWPQNAISEVEKFHLQERDIVLAMDRPWIEAGLKYASVTSSDLPALLVQRVARMRGSDQIDNRYLKYVIASSDFTDHILNITTGTAVPHISGKDILSYKLRLPSLETQREIGKTLSLLDDKIELNRKTSATLEAMARALYRSWFVDFDPVNAKAEGRAPAHMDAPTATLFPNSFDTDGLPQGWVKTRLGSLIKRHKVGKTYDQKSVTETGAVPVLDQGKSGVIGFHDDAPSIVASENARIAVFANHTCLQRLIDTPFSTIQNVIPFSGAEYPTEWCHYASLGRQKFEEYRGHWPSFVDVEVVVPSVTLARRFSETVDIWLRKISQIHRESHTLAQLRDTLLPRLMSGELRVKAAEEMIEEAL